MKSLPKNVSMSFGKYEGRARVGGVVKRQRFSKLEDAKAFVEKCMQEQVDFKSRRGREKRSMMEQQRQKRDARISKSGDLSELEHQCCLELKSVLEKGGLDVIVLNEFTLPDIIVKPNGHQFKSKHAELQIQRGATTFQSSKGMT